MSRFNHWQTLIVGLFLAPFVTHAASNYSPGDFADVSQNMVNEMVELVAIQAAHRPYRPASALAPVIGLEVGVDAVILNTSSGFVTALQAATDSSADPSVVPLPRLGVHKGLPGGFEIGFSLFPGGSTGKLTGFDLKYSLPLAIPKIAARINYTTSTLWFIKTKTWAFDGLISLPLPVIEPYFGLSLLLGSGELTTSTNLPGGVDANPSVTKTSMFFGLPIKLLFLKLTAEYAMVLGGETNYGVKASISL